jgi:hypothetical protein
MRLKYTACTQLTSFAVICLPLSVCVAEVPSEARLRFDPTRMRRRHDSQAIIGRYPSPGDQVSRFVGGGIYTHWVSVEHSAQPWGSLPVIFSHPVQALFL